MMERYTVIHKSDVSGSLPILVPFEASSSVGLLREEVARRLARAGITINASKLQLRLNTVDGPILDGEDSLESVIRYTERECIISLGTTDETPDTSQDKEQPTRDSPSASEASCFKLRVITPALARQHNDLRQIPTISASFTLDATLRQLRHGVAQHLSVFNDLTSSGEVDGAECNCTLAKAILNGELVKAGDVDFKHQFLAIHSQSMTCAMEMPESREGLDEKAMNELNITDGTKFVMVHRSPNVDSDLAIVTICSKTRHGASGGQHRALAVPGFQLRRQVLDLHTIECPITTPYVDQTLRALGLENLIVDEVLNIFAVSRQVAPSQSQVVHGKEGIYMGGHQWEVVPMQTERGTAMFLSSLRVFVHLASQNPDDRGSHDKILHILNILTNFPPAVRAMHSLLEGNAISPEECSALVQPMFELMSDMIKNTVLAKDKSRVLEGSRLFFGMVLGKAKDIIVDTKDGPLLPYIEAMETINLVNTETMEPLACPVDTPIGLMERGCFDAIQAGVIQFTDADLNSALVEVPVSGPTLRAAFLNGGRLSKAIMFNVDKIYSNYQRYRYHGTREAVLPIHEMTDVMQHAVTATLVKLSMVQPLQLGSAPNPVLTLDRDGLAAVYLGRQGCGTAGKDFLIFRPTKGGECVVDPAIIDQLLQPLLKARIADGSAIFDGVHAEGLRREIDAPDEILMICVDCSASMRASVGFDDIDDSHDDIPEQSPEDLLLDDIRANEINTDTLDDTKEKLMSHDSFHDIACTVRACRQNVKTAAATVLLNRLVEYQVRKLQGLNEKLEHLQARTFWSGRRVELDKASTVISELRGTIAGLLSHRSALVEFIIYKSCCLSDAERSTSWKWKHRDPLPEPTASRDQYTAGFLSAALDLQVPPELRCPMTQELFEKPVRTRDGNIYEQSAILTWFRIKNTSPLTGLALEDTAIVSDRSTRNGVREWKAGKDILDDILPSSLRRQRQRHGTQTLRWKLTCSSSLGVFRLEVPNCLKCKQLYELVFRQMKGRHAEFTLLHGETALVPNDESLSGAGLSDREEVVIKLPPLGRDQGASERPGSSEFSLIKVYGDSHDVLFSYWTQQNTKAMVESVYFKTWRHKAESGDFDFSAIQLFSRMRKQGDGYLSGVVLDPLENLSRYLDSSFATGRLGDEPLYNKRSRHSGSMEEGEEEEDDGDDDDGEDDENAKQDADEELNQERLDITVLKVGVFEEKKKRSKARRPHTSRLELLKQMFDQFVNRILAYQYSTHLGLVTFSDKPRVSRRLTHVVEDFRTSTRLLRSEGDTALWDALALAEDQIQEHAAAYPGVKKRILCISDGVDTSSSHTSLELCRSLKQNAIVLDSFCLGDEYNSTLRTVSLLTGGFKFHPTSLRQAMAICEMEPVLCQLEREANGGGHGNPRVTSLSLSNAGNGDHNITQTAFESARLFSRPETVTPDVFPKRKQHPNLADSFSELRATPRTRMMPDTTGSSQGGSAAAASSSSSSSSSSSNNAMRTYRCMAEMQRIATNPHPHYDVYVCDRNMMFWKVVMQGPPGSVYESGTFVLYLDMDDGYPVFAPKARFVTPIQHPNVNLHGRICHSIFDRNWTADTSNAAVLATIYGLLLEPDYNDPVNIVVTLDFHHDQVAFADVARMSIQKHALKTREAWRAEILPAGAPVSS